MLTGSKKIRINSFIRSIYAVATAAMLLCAVTTSPTYATEILYSSAGVSAVQGLNTQVFSEFSTGTSFASEVGLSGAYSASAIAQTGYRSNHITAFAGKSTTSGFSSASATSRWTDGLFFAGGTGTGFVTFEFSISGSIQGGDSVGFNFDFDLADDYCCSDSIGHVFRGPTVVSGFTTSLLAEFTYNLGGDPIIIEGELYGGATVSRGDTGSATTNFSNSAILTRVIVPDGVTITSTSGTDYSKVLGTTTIPEPGTLALFGVGLAGLGFMRRRRTVQADRSTGRVPV